MSETDNAPQAVTMTFAPPIITANMMPHPDVSVDKQSAEEWFKVFKEVADSLIGIYTAANQGVVGQRQALATLPSLLNRNESEKRLANRILSECTTVEEAEKLIQRTIGDLESECQASETVFLMKRGNASLEDLCPTYREREESKNRCYQCYKEIYIRITKNYQKQNTKKILRTPKNYTKW